jgi:hypothetical protein
MKRKIIAPGLAVLGMAAATAILSSGPSQASVTTGHTRTISGNEYISGAVHGKTVLANTLTFHLRWRGLISQSSEFTLPGAGGKGSSATLSSRPGGLEVTLTSNFAFKVLAMNSRTCYVVGQTSGTLAVDGATGTGLFDGAAGTGSLAETLGAFRPKNKDGTCNIFGTLTNPRGAFDLLKVNITPLTIAATQHHN